MASSTADGLESRHWINNEFVESTPKRSCTIRSPFDDSFVGTIPIADKDIVDAAVSAARKAFETGSWPTLSAAERAQCLLTFADLVETKVDEIATIEAKSIGQPAIVVKHMARTCTATYRYYAGWADKVAGESYREEDGSYKIVQYEPYGVCAGIAAWNATLMYLAFKIAPALASGNTVVFKTSEKAPFTPLALANLYQEAGFPPGVVNFISGDGSTGALMAAHMDIDKISFTGSGITGAKIEEAAAKSNLKNVTLELGGKSPAVIFEDADIENAIKQNSQGFLINTSQVCAAISRVFVQKTIAPQFIEALKNAFQGAAYAFGTDPLEPTTLLGPIADKLQFDRIMDFIQSGKTESGAELVVGGDKIERGKGLFIEPTIFLNADNDAAIYQEEIFGPVLNIKTFETEEEAIKLANNTNYGLSSAVYTSNITRALRVASKIRAGTVGINGVALPSPSIPFGGFKHSGHGRELGKAGILAYLQEKSISINMAV